MVCIYCEGTTQVTNSRHQKRPNQVWRRRHCATCGATFSTHEAAAYEDAWRVQSETGQLMPFHKNKLFLSLYKACEHRKQAVTDATALTDTVVGLLRNQTNGGLLPTASIVTAAYSVLKNFDTAAAVHYQAFHPA